MAVRILRFLGVIVAVALLGSCQVLEFIFSSVFPSTVTLAKAQASLSGDIGPNETDSFSLRLIEAGIYGYVVVVGARSSGPVAFIYDLDLNLKKTVTGFTGSGVMFDTLNGLLMVGNHELNLTDLSDAATQPPTGAQINSARNSGVDGFYSGTYNVANITLDPGTSSLYEEAYNATWNSLAHPAPPTYPPVLSTSITNTQLEAILDDGAGAGNIILVISQGANNGGSSSATCYLLSIAKTGFGTGSPAFAGLLDSAVHRDKLGRESFGFSQGSVFAYDESSSSFVRMDPTTAGTQASFYSPADYSNTRFVYRIAGGSFYGYDTKARVLTKYTSWW